MATLSGKAGKVMIGVAELAEITRWTLTTVSNNPAYASSGTAGYKRRVAGVKDASGMISFKLDPADAITADLNEGDSVTLLLYLDGSHFYSVPALVDSLQLEVDIDSGDIVGGTAEFSANGAWSKPTYS
jgi:hypothetical protein